MDIKFEKPPVHFTPSGVPYVDPVDILLSKVGQEEISKMANGKASREVTHIPVPTQVSQP